jgi:peptidoglycan/LPS O-acetylase OafA/YrhL
MTATAPEVGSGADAPSPAVAPPPGSPRFALFDAVRGIAVLFIIAFHVASITGTINDATVGRGIIALGNQALILFFVISAFLLYRPFVSARAAGRPLPSVSRYARRRVLRIVPAYWVALTVLAIFPGIVGVFSGGWWRFYGFAQLYSHDRIGQGIPPAWSLCVEVTFYAALPLWAWTVRRLPTGDGPRGWLGAELGALALAGAAGIAFQVAASRHVISDLVAQALPGQAIWLSLGMALAVWSVHDQRSEGHSRAVRFVMDHSGLCWLGAAGAGVALSAMVHEGGLFGLLVALRAKQAYETTFGSIALTGILAVLVVLPAVFGERGGGLPRRLLRWAPVAWLGLVSYSVYLYHLAVAELIGNTTDPHFSASGLGLVQHVHHLTTPVLFILTLSGSCVLAGLSYYFVELPFLRRKEAGPAPGAGAAGLSGSAAPARRSRRGR